MPNSLEIDADSRRLRFNENFTVDELTATGDLARSTGWDSHSTEKENEISFSFPGETKTSLAVNYRFTDRNQLALKVIEQSGVPVVSAEWTLAGKIIVDDVNDVDYAVLDETGQPGKKITVYSTLSFNSDHTQLQVLCADKVETFITGIGQPSDNLTTDEYPAGTDLARDLLAFQAVTTNTVGGKDKDFDADITFYGRWDMHENALVFVTHYDSTSGTPAGYLALGGTIKGTNFGLIVEQNGDTVLQINGRYAWNKNTLGWDMSVGYSKDAGLEARLNVDAAFQGKKGKLALKGGATLKKGEQGTDLEFDLNLTYTAANQKIVFTMTGGDGNYEIKLSGDFKIVSGNVTFSLTASDEDGKKRVVATVEFGNYTKNSNLKVALKATLLKNNLQLELDMKFSLYWGPNGPVTELP